MKRSFTRIAAAVAVFALSGALAAGAGYGDGIQSLAMNKQPIKVFIKDVSNESGQAQVVADDFMKELEKAFANRKSVSFAIAKTIQDSDVAVMAVIKSYQYLKNDPVKPSLSFIMALDAATSENFAEMAADFTVTDSKNGSVLWQENVTSYVKRMMSPEESMPLVYDKLARHFVSKAFGKGE